MLEGAGQRTHATVGPPNASARPASAAPAPAPAPNTSVNTRGTLWPSDLHHETACGRERRSYDPHRRVGRAAHRLCSSPQTTFRPSAQRCISVNAGPCNTPGGRTSTAVLPRTRCTSSRITKLGPKVTSSSGTWPNLCTSRKQMRSTTAPSAPTTSGAQTRRDRNSASCATEIVESSTRQLAAVTSIARRH